MLHTKFLSQLMPRGAGILFIVKLLFIITYSIVSSTLILYLCHTLHFPPQVAASITATFLAFIGIFRLIAGFIGDRFLSYQQILVLAFISLFSGCLLISNPKVETLYWGLSALMLGSGLMIAPNCILTQLLPSHDHRRESAFLFNYVGINIGYIFGFFISGYYQLYNAYSDLFLFAGIAALIALLILCFKWQRLFVSDFVIKQSQCRNLVGPIKGITLLICLLCIGQLSLEYLYISNAVIYSAAAIMAVVIICYALQQSNQDLRVKLRLFLFLCLISLVFWTLSSLTPILLTLFIENNVDRNYFGILIAPQWVQMINSFVIILGAPLLILLFGYLKKIGLQIKLTTKFSVALIFVGASFVVLAIGVKFSNTQGLTNFNWILLSYVLQSLGELFIVPVGFAMVGQLISIDFQGRMMALWMMLMGIGANLAGYISSNFLLANQSTNPIFTNASYVITFEVLGWLALSIGTILLLFTSHKFKFAIGKLQHLLEINKFRN